MLTTIGKFILNAVPEPPAVAIVLGSGLADFSDNLSGVVRIPYAEIPGYPLPSVSGHVGEFAFGYIGSLPVLCARGRFHYYEGHPLETVTLPIQVFKAVGCSTVILTNAAGCLRRQWNLGDLMVITAHLDFTFRTSARDPLVLAGGGFHDPDLVDIAMKVAGQNDLPLRQGAYCWTLGPTYETPAEIGKIRTLGGDAVGMSTVPELQTARDLGLKTLGISCLTNYAAGISPEPLSHAEVLETTQRVKQAFADLLIGILNIL
ncbi:MAG: purine-nucleoside phosphorylase [FCB group bacterium]|nr:purine-nucleoside phosphorylase [FCB group bacterium]